MSTHNRNRRKQRPSKPMPRPDCLPPDAKIVRNMPGAANMSDVLEKFVEPYLHVATTEAALNKLLSVGMIAWHAALLDAVKRQELIQATKETLPPEARDDFISIVTMLIQRKLDHFADNRRMILSYQLDWNGGKFHLQVISTPPPSIGGSAPAKP